MLTCRSDAGRDKLRARLDEQLLHLNRVFTATPPGTTVRVISPEGNVFYGVVSHIIQKGQRGSPSAPTNWRAQILIDHRSRQLTIPLSKFNRGKEDSATLVTTQDKNWNGEAIYEAFDLRQQQTQRTEMQIFTGNPIKAYEKFPKGKFVNYTNNQGEVLQGLVMPASFDIQEALRSEAVAFSEPSQVRAFLTDITQNRASVKTLDELLTIKTQASARFGNTTATGFVLQTVKSSIGDKYSLDADVINAAGAEFYSVSDRMECIVPPERIDDVLKVVLQEKHWTLAAFDFKDQARDLLKIKLPEFCEVQTETTTESQSSQPAIPASNQPMGAAEQNIKTLLERANLTEAVMANTEFYLQIPNEPFIPLTIERHQTDLHFIHWLKDSQGDLFIDAEMIFHLSNQGTLKLKETAVQNILTGGESRGCDRTFANLFSRNLLEQGFTEAVQKQQQPAQPLAKEGPKLADWQIINREGLKASAIAYLQLKDQNPNALVFQRSPSGAFYEAFFSDATAIAKELNFAIIHRDLGGSAKAIPTLMLPVQSNALTFCKNYLEQQGFTVIIDEGKTQSSETTQPSGIKALADQVRNYDLVTVVERLGLERDPHDKQKWRNEDHIISITKEQFKDWSTDKGGGGAIDLVMHVRQVDFKTAVEWLAGQSLPKAALPQPQEVRQFQLPQADEQHWSTVRQYLVETRGLPQDWVDRLHQKGLIYADNQRNAVFLRHPEHQDGQVWARGHSTGASLRGTQAEPFHRLASGSSREQGWFWIRQGKGEIQRVVLVESAIDALSLAALEREKLQNPVPTVYLSTDGSGAVPIATLKTTLANQGQVIVAFDADKAGEKMAWRVAESVPGVRRMTPAMGKDWNDRLLAEHHLNREIAEVDRGDKQTLKSLWKWHRVALEIGKPEAYVQRVAQVAREFVEGVALSEKAIAAMQRDFQILDQKSPDQSQSEQAKLSIESGL